VRQPEADVVPTSAVLVHQPPLMIQAEVVHRSLAKNLSQAKVDPSRPRTSYGWAVNSALVRIRRRSRSRPRSCSGSSYACGNPRVRSPRKVASFSQGITGTVQGRSVQSKKERHMNSAETIEQVPIHTDADGVVRVAGTRVTLDTIAQQYSSVPLADVYSVITYDLRHKSEVCAYLQRREGQAETVRAEVERRFPSTGLRERLLARRQ